MRQQQSADSVALSRTALNFAASLTTAAFLGFAGIFWNVYADSVRTDERLKALEEFVPKSGERYTAAMASADRLAHREWVREQVAVIEGYVYRDRVRMQEIDNRIRALESCCIKNGNGAR